MKIVSGVQPTNSLTLGNYLGAIKPFVKLQKKNELIVFIADLHSITNDFDAMSLKQAKLDVAKIYLASGIDEKKVIIFNQSDVSEHLELSWILICHTNLGQLNRMTQFKDKSQKKEANNTTRVPTGLLIYPVLMAADILLYSPDIVPVGNDQKQHLELTRDIASNFNAKYNCDIFKIPEFSSPQIGGKIMDLQDPTIKMSKSNQKTEGTIFLLDNKELIFKKIKSAKTDMNNKICFDPVNQAGLSNLLSIYASLSNQVMDVVVEKFKNHSYRDFKEAVSEIIWIELEKIQVKYFLISNSKIDEILKNGSLKAKDIAVKKLKEVKMMIGLINEKR